MKKFFELLANAVDGPRLKVIIKFFEKIKERTFIINLIVAFLLYTFFKSLIVEFLARNFFNQPFVINQSWTPFYDILIIIVWVSLIFKNVVLKKTLVLKLVDYIILIFIAHNEFVGDWTYLYVQSLPIRYVDLVLAYYILVVIKLCYVSIKAKRIESSGYFNLDHPIESNEDDRLNRIRVSTHIYSSISELRPKKAFLIGINGHWGKGKTSIVALLKNRISENRDMKFIEFNPWLFEDADSLVTSFLNLMENEIDSSEGEFSDYKKALLAAEDKILGTPFLSLFTRSDLTLQEQKDKINTLLEQGNQLHVVSIDDLDRLTNKEIINVFRLVRIVADFTNIVYIVSYDRIYVEQAISSFVPHGMAGDYLDKMFQVEFSVPEPEYNQIINFLFDNLEQQLISVFSRAESLDEIRKQSILQELGVLRTKKFYREIIRTMRDVKRFTNNFLLRYLSIYRDVDFTDFFCLELIRYESHAAHLLILSQRDKIISYFAIGSSYTGLHRYENILKDTQILAITSGRQDLNDIFYEAVLIKPNSRYPFTNKLFFDKYFSLDHYKNQISDDELSRLLASRNLALVSDTFSRWINNGAEEELNYKLLKTNLAVDELNSLVLGTVKFYIKNYKIDELPQIHPLLPSLAVGVYKVFLNGKTEQRIEMIESAYESFQQGDLGYASYFLQGFREFSSAMEKILAEDKSTMNTFTWMRTWQIRILSRYLESKEIEIESLTLILINIRWFIGVPKKQSNERRFLDEVWHNSELMPLLQKQLLPLFGHFIKRCSIYRMNNNAEQFRHHYSANFVNTLFDSIFYTASSFEKFTMHQSEIREFLDFVSIPKRDDKPEFETFEFRFSFLEN